jgi:catechol 2,3-dioxygenase
MALKGVLRLGEVGVRVMDIDAARRHYVEHMGLHEMMTDEAGKKLYCKAWDEHDHHSLVLQEADTAGLEYVAFKVDSDATLDEFEPKIREFGLEVAHIEAGVYPKSGRRLEFILPSGHRTQLYAEKEQVGNTLGTRNPGVIPDEGVVRGFRINRLDHCLLGGPNIDESARFFKEVFDFVLSERIEDLESRESLAVFLTCSNKPHDIAFLINPEPGRFHHVSFLLESETDVIHAADLIGKHRIPVDVGPNRHGVTRGNTIYYFDPSGNRNEVFAGGYVHYPDTPTLTWDTSEMGPAQFSQDNTPRESFLSVLT